MKTSTLFTLLTSLAFSSFSIVVGQDATTVSDTILTSAAADSIDLTVLDFLPAALSEIEETYATNDTTTEAKRRDDGRFMRRQTIGPTNIVDTHVHVVPAWYKNLYPEIGGSPVPDWTMDDQLSFMAGQGIERAIIAFSTPGPNVWVGNKVLTVALARLLNEQAAAYCRAYPNKFNFYAQVPLPWTSEAIREAQYAINELGAVGIWVQSNVEGKYLGDVSFTPFFQAMNSWGGRQILYIHPAVPVLQYHNQLIEANPTPYITGKIEFYFETARTLMDLTLTQTIHNFTNIHYVIPHVGGAFPSTVDRILKSYPTLYDSSFQIYNTRFWWDSAGPTYFHQVSGLLGMGVPKTQLLYGTDFPYAPLAPQAPSLAAVKNSPLFTAAEKTAIFRTNAQNLFGNKIQW
ncbi:hypothetical protein GALMADRAFT_246767 [Galerina marginata CBS 339.88]|uniref:Amidohydrolase-related domain-containing protein n=1 Tax=Galerina marginata (strain CBS 339.88) TaxID=685588 RepID=A0A067SZX3_GALM3|nr:hypothetical protein GALMADRAFT_246767 [Galerina marginata CBS 339.88]